MPRELYCATLSSEPGDNLNAVAIPIGVVIVLFANNCSRSCKHEITSPIVAVILACRAAASSD